MDIERFRHSPIGELTPIRVEQHDEVIEHFAFVPSPLPDSISLRPETYAVIERAATELGLLEGTAHRLDNPYIVTRPLMRREAQSTSALEGTYSTLEDLFALDLEDGGTPESDELGEVWNYVQAAEQAVAMLADRPVSLSMIGELHQILMRGSEHEASSGRVRTSQVAIGPRGTPITEARFVPPPPSPGLVDLFSDWERWNYRDDSIPLVPRVAISHYQFEAIHPFMDGNGRLGRLIAVLLLIDRGPLSNHYLVLSPYLETRRSRYQDLLAHTSETGEFDPWVRFFAGAVAAEAQAARHRMTALLEYPQEVVQRLRALGLKGAVIDLAKLLLEHPIMSVPQAQRLLGVTYQTANRVIGTLVGIGVLEEVTGGSYGRLFAARKIFELLRRPTTG